ncbi:MAG: hypothetical protein GY699_22420 [Desulfobacteraceae bacterium]|nr:hypothetical protein [Desulfobacteraceae bacterium]
MYLSEEKRSEIRKCFENQQSNQRDNSKSIENHIKGFHDTKDVRKVSQILFDARDGKEVFTPF